LREDAGLEMDDASYWECGMNGWTINDKENEQNETQDIGRLLVGHSHLGLVW
jgi:hypothetical protein